MSLLKSLDRMYVDWVGYQFYTFSIAQKTKLSYHLHLYLEIISVTENCTVSYIAKKTNVAKSAVTVKVNELVRLGYVEREVNPNDKRMFYLRATDKRDELQKKLDIAYLNAIQNIEEKYSKEECALFCAMLDMFSDILEKNNTQIIKESSHEPARNKN